MLIRGVVSSPVRGVVGSGFGGDTFSLAAFMASQSAGFWHNFLRTDTMFQEDVGPTPADEPNEVIGLALSQRLWGGQTRTGYLAGQPEISSNGDFESGGTGWTAGSGVTFSSGQAVWTSSVAGVSQSAAALVAGRTYAFTVVIAAISAGGLRFNSGGAGYTGPTYTAPRTYTSYLTPTTGGAISLGAVGTTTAQVDSLSVREVSQVPATQSTTSFKPKFQTTGAAFDGTDDNLLTNYTAGSGANFLIAKVVVPASVSAVGIISGAINSGAGRFWLGINTAGRLIGGVGDQSLSTIIGTSDLRGRTATVALSADGGLVRLFADNTQEYEGAQAGTPSSVNPFRIGALNDSAATTFFGGSIQHALAGREFIDLARFQQIANALGA